MARATGRRLDWDSAFFGVPVGQAQAETSADVEATEAWAEREGIRCVYLLVAADRLDATQAAETRGYFLTGVHLTCLRPAPLNGPAAAGDGVVGIRAARSSDIPALERIAAKVHGDTRFYADTNFPRALCDRLYETWIRRSCEGWADHVLTAEHDGRTVGYISLHLRADREGAIGLVGVASDARRMGIGRSLVDAALAWFRDQDVVRVSVTTQGQNIAALRVYQQAGFAVSRVDLWLHKWR
jgi:dTDP-4-amino-4,6-dideoxy-D-galactose acyltransferase